VSADQAGGDGSVTHDLCDENPINCATAALHVIVNDVLEGDTTLPNFATMVHTFTGRDVEDKTGLTGFSHVSMDSDSVGARRPLSFERQSSLFTTVRERLGIKLQPSRTQVDVLAIDKIERPSQD